MKQRVLPVLKRFFALLLCWFFTTNALTPGAPEREFTQTESFIRALRDFCYRFVAKLEEFFTSPTAGFCR